MQNSAIRFNSVKLFFIDKLFGSWYNQIKDKCCLFVFLLFKFVVIALSLSPHTLMFEGPALIVSRLTGSFT